MKTPHEQAMELAASVGDPRPPHAGGPDSDAMVAWHARWSPVERALAMGQAAAWLAGEASGLIREYGRAGHLAQLDRALDSYRHHVAARAALDGGWGMRPNNNGCPIRIEVSTCWEALKWAILLGRLGEVCITVKP